MNLILLCHPSFLGSTSMPRFARLIGEGMRERGHSVTYVTSPEVFGRLPVPFAAVRKWLGYLDQFLLFPPRLRAMARQAPADTLFVIVDQALGMWVPAIRNRAHVVHCHDFLAQRSALGEFPENPTGRSGQVYQALIRRGYRQARSFISVSRKTQADLQRFLPNPPAFSEVVYNPLNNPFTPLPRAEALARLGPLAEQLADGFVLHVGGNQWYKNRRGVVEIYRAYARGEERPLPLLMVGRKPPAALREIAATVSAPGRVIFETSLDDGQVHAAYAAAEALLFPSLEEGFGWPIAEAQACGCPVITTAGEPMTEVGWDTALYLPRRPTSDPREVAGWAEQGAEVLRTVLGWSAGERLHWTDRGRQNAHRFVQGDVLARFEELYLRVLRES